MSSKKVYVHYKEDFTLKVIVEVNTPFSDILVKFLNAFEEHRQANGGSELTYFNTFLLNSKNKKMQMKSKALNLVEDGDDLHVELDLEASKRVKDCNNAGCGQTYTDESNRSDACWYHPGRPVFHEGRKGWTCCPKRVDDFEEAMAMPGCTLGGHKSVAPEIKAQVMLNKPVDPKYLPKSSANGVETFALEGSVGSRPASSNAVVAPAPVQIVEEPDDALDLVIAMGTKCRHNGCKDVFQGEHSRTEHCVYHPGLAVFHEGSKYWTCCKPRCAEFEEFLKIEGCKVGRHKFGPKLGDDSSDPLQVKCRHDFYQQGEHVIACVYGKNMNKTSSKIDFEPEHMKVKIEFNDGKHFHKDFHLFGEIDPARCSYEILSTKCEIKLTKATPIVWDSLEPTDPSVVQ
jgi:hypothetical protein